MAREIIKTLFSTKIVSSIELDAGNRTRQLALNCQVKVDQKAEVLQFTFVARALPFPVGKAYLPALELLPFQEKFNQEKLREKKLTAGNYVFQIDGKPVDTLSAGTLEQGVNLALNPSTPQYQQAADFFQLCQSYHKICGQRPNLAFIEYRSLGDYEGPDTEVGKGGMSPEQHIFSHKSLIGVKCEILHKKFLNLPTFGSLQK